MKETLKKIWIYVKLYGGYALTAVLVVVGAIMFATETNKHKELVDLLKKQSDAYHKQLEDMAKVQEQERKRHEEIEATYQQVLTKIEQDKAASTAALDQSKKDQIREIVAATHDNPALMASNLNSLFGIQVYP